MSQVRALLFDLDGVLVDSRDAWFRTIELAGSLFGGVGVTRERFNATFGQGTAAEIRLHNLQCTAEELDHFFVQHFPAFLAQVAVEPGAHSLLRGLAGRGIARAVTTNSVSGIAEGVLEAGGLRPLFDTVVCSDQVDEPKPAPDLLFEAMRRLGVTHKECWMVGDSRYDAEAARAAGVHFVGFRRPGDLRVETLSEIADLLPA